MSTLLRKVEWRRRQLILSVVALSQLISSADAHFGAGPTRERMPGDESPLGTAASVGRGGGGVETVTSDPDTLPAEGAEKAATIEEDEGTGRTEKAPDSPRNADRQKGEESTRETGIKGDDSEGEGEGEGDVGLDPRDATYREEKGRKREREREGRGLDEALFFEPRHSRPEEEEGEAEEEEADVPERAEVRTEETEKSERGESGTGPEPDRDPSRLRGKTERNEEEREEGEEKRGKEKADGGGGSKKEGTETDGKGASEPGTGAGTSEGRPGAGADSSVAVRSAGTALLAAAEAAAEAMILARNKDLPEGALRQATQAATLEIAKSAAQDWALTALRQNFGIGRKEEEGARGGGKEESDASMRAAVRSVTDSPALEKAALVVAKMALATAAKAASGGGMAGVAGAVAGVALEAAASTETAARMRALALETAVSLLAAATSPDRPWPSWREVALGASKRLAEGAECAASACARGIRRVVKSAREPEEVASPPPTPPSSRDSENGPAGPGQKEKEEKPPG